VEVDPGGVAYGRRYKNIVITVFARSAPMSNDKTIVHHGPFGGVYFLAFVGSAVYYIQHSSGFWEGLLGVLKALVWPAMLMYRLMSQLGM
jgi:hypothetical protein